MQVRLAHKIFEDIEGNRVREEIAFHIQDLQELNKDTINWSTITYLDAERQSIEVPVTLEELENLRQLYRQSMGIK